MGIATRLPEVADTIVVGGGTAGSVVAAVVDADGRVHGIEGLYVADGSIMPVVTSGNTNMPIAVIGERLARSLLGLPLPSPRLGFRSPPRG